MGSFFGHPLFLAGMVLVSLPWIIEWLFRRRKRQVDLPTIRYLLNNEEEEKIKRQDRILLLLRSLGIFLLVFAVSRPIIQKGLFGAAGKRDIVVILDGTASMNQQVGLTTAFGLAQKRAAGLIRGLPESARVSVVHFGKRPELLIEQEQDVYTAAAQIEALRSGLGSCPIEEALRFSTEYIKDNQLSDSEIYIFSDFQKNTWLPPGGKAGSSTKKFTDIMQQGKVFLVDVGSEIKFNFMVTDLRPDEYVMTTGMPVTFRVRTETWGTPPEDAKATITFLVDGIKKDMRELSFAKEKQVLVFEHQFLQPGEHIIEVALEGDEHHIDNKRSYLCTVPENFKVLIIDERAHDPTALPGAVAGTPESSEQTLDMESAYIVSAIEPPSHPGMPKVSRFSATVINPGRLSYENLETYPLIILTQVSGMNEVLAASLKNYVSEGGAVWVFFGPGVNIYDYNKHLYKDGEGILPCKIETKVAAQGENPYLRFGLSSHPAITALSESVNKDTQVLEYADIKPVKGSRTILSLTNKAPLLIEREFGAGRVLFSGTTAGTGWTYFPATMEFPILVQEMTRHLIGNPDRDVNLQTGDTFKQPVYISTRHLLLRMPTGNKVRLTPAKVDDESDTLMLRFDDTVHQGVYQIVDTPAEVIPRTRFVVNQKSEESNLKKLSKDGFKDAFGGGDWFWCGPETPIEDISSKLYSVIEIAPWIFWIFAIVLTAESLLAVRFGRRRKIRTQTQTPTPEQGEPAQ